MGALSSGVTGLQAHQKMLDVAGNNLANVNTTAFKASRITFSELLSETIKKASQPSGTIGGTNPQQMGSGVGISGISPNMSQGNIVNTGNPLDMAMEGEGYFVLSDGDQNIYTRSGTFAVDASSNLVDPATGYIVQRIGTTGESDLFQIGGVNNIHVPYDVAMAANATSLITLAGNLSANAAFDTPQTNVLKSNIEFTTNDGILATADTLIANLDQYTGTLASGVITFSGYKPDGTALGSSPAADLTMPVTATTTLGDVLAWLNTSDGTAAVSEVQTVALTGGTGTPTQGTYTLTYDGEKTDTLAWNASATDIETALEDLSNVEVGDITVSGGLLTGTTFTFADTLGDVGMITITDVATLKDVANVAITGACAETTPGHKLHGLLGDNAIASISSGKLTITDAASGYSKSDIAMTWSDGTPGNTLEVPTYFEVPVVGGEETKNVNITLYDSLGGEHVLSGTFVRTNTADTWDFLLTAITGNVGEVDIERDISSGQSNRRISGIKFDGSDGSFKSIVGDTAQFEVTFATSQGDLLVPQTLTMNFGLPTQFNGLTQFSGNSTAVARGQDGYEAGNLSTVSVNKEGILIGAFSNGVKKNLATLQIALFQNTAGLESVGTGYFIPSANSGEVVRTEAMGSGGAGSLEKSNADVATEFVNMIQAQNGFQANARTIRVANEILRELTSLIS